MDNYVSYKVEFVTTENLLSHYDPKTINKYCEACNKFSKVWSCPPLPFKDRDYLTRFKYCYIISAKVLINSIPKDELSSMVNYSLNKYSDISISKDEFSNIFNGIYYKFREFNDVKILSLEKYYEDSVALVSGRCLICSQCTRPSGESCSFPDKLRYSLESLGLNVTSIIENILKDKIEWSNDKKPEYVTAVSALLSNNKIPTHHILEKLNKL